MHAAALSIMRQTAKMTAVVWLPKPTALGNCIRIDGPSCMQARAGKGATSAAGRDPQIHRDMQTSTCQPKHAMPEDQVNTISKPLSCPFTASQGICQDVNCLIHHCTQPMWPAFRPHPACPFTVLLEERRSQEKALAAFRLQGRANLAEATLQPLRYMCNDCLTLRMQALQARLAQKAHEGSMAFS